MQILLHSLVLLLLLPTYTISLILQNPNAFYVHVPFCKARCSYCDFSIVSTGTGVNNKPSSSSWVNDLHEQYTTSIVKEIELTRTAITSSSSKAITQPAPLSSVYFGGGTPSLLSCSNILKILTTIEKHYKFDDNAEITIECDPATFDRKYLENLIAGKINRVSIGVQSFDDKVLSEIGRTHDSSDILTAINLLNEFTLNGRLKNGWSLDLICGCK